LPFPQGSLLIVTSFWLGTVVIPAWAFLLSVGEY